LTTKNRIWEICRRTIEDDTKYGKSMTRDYITHVISTSTTEGAEREKGGGGEKI